MPHSAWNPACAGISARQIPGDSGLVPVSEIAGTGPQKELISAARTQQEGQETAQACRCASGQRGAQCRLRCGFSVCAEEGAKVSACLYHTHLENPFQARDVRFCAVYHQNHPSKLKRA